MTIHDGDLAGASASPEVGKIPPRNRRLPREVRVRHIQAAAFQVFREHGYEGGSIGEIARLSGLAEGALYKFYKSKREILETVICEWYAVTLTDYKAAYKQITDPYDRVKFAIRHNIDCLCDDVAIANLYLALRRDKDFRSSRLTDFNKEYIGLMKSTISELQGLQHTSAPPLKPSLIVEMIYSMIETRTELFRFGERKINKSEITDQIYELTLRVI